MSLLARALLPAFLVLLSLAPPAAAQAYEGIDIPWTSYRPLTDAERREMQTTTEFLRELAAGMLDE